MTSCVLRVQDLHSTQEHEQSYAREREQEQERERETHTKKKASKALECSILSGEKSHAALSMQSCTRGSQKGKEAVMISVHTDGGSEEMKLHTEHRTDSQAHIHNSMITAERERDLLYTTGSLLMPLFLSSVFF